MSDDTSASVWNDGGPPEIQEQKPKSPPPPLPTSNPVVKDTPNVVPTGDLIQFESEEERAATTVPNGNPVIFEKNPAMDGLLREFLKEEEAYTPQDYLRRFYQIRVEQEKLRMEAEYRSECAVAPQHYARNRYRDILPYDKNRVEIQKDSENPEGYMNASLIQLPGGKTEFIAAQAPLPATLDEWYRLMELKNEHF